MRVDTLSHMTHYPIWMARVQLGTGIAGVVLGLVIALGAPFLIVSSTTELGRITSTGISDEAVRMTDALDAAVLGAVNGLESAEAAVRSAAVAVAIAGKVTEDLEEVVSGRVASSLEAIQTSMPGLVSTANVVDNTMGALSWLGVDYDPEIPLDTSIELIAAELEGLPDALREQSPAMKDAANRLRQIAVDMVMVAGDLDEVSDHLEEANSASSEIASVVSSFDEELSSLSRRVHAIRVPGSVFAIVFGLALAAASAGTAVQGRWMLNNASEDQEEEDSGE